MMFDVAFGVPWWIVAWVGVYFALFWPLLWGTRRLRAQTLAARPSGVHVPPANAGELCGARHKARHDFLLCAG